VSPGSFECPHCGAEVRSGRRSCPECGSDATTGWQSSEEIDYQSLDIPGGHGEPTGPLEPVRRRARWPALVFVLLLVALLLFLLRGR
jgi:hypothetical protein